MYCTYQHQKNTIYIYCLPALFAGWSKLGFFIMTNRQVDFEPLAQHLSKIPGLSAFPSSFEDLVRIDVFLTSSIHRKHEFLCFRLQSEVSCWRNTILWCHFIHTFDMTATYEFWLFLLRLMRSENLMQHFPLKISQNQPLLVFIVHYSNPGIKIGSMIVCKIRCWPSEKFLLIWWCGSISN